MILVTKTSDQTRQRGSVCVCVYISVCAVVVVDDDSYIQCIALAAEETTMTQ